MRYFFGEWRDDSRPLTPDDIAALSRTARERQRELEAYPTDKIYRLMARVSRKWADPAYPRRRALEAKLPAETGFSREMIDLGMKELTWTLSPDVLIKKVETELQGVPRAGSWKYDPRTRSALSWHPLGVVLHVLSGNVFLVGAGSLVEGLLTGNVTVLKMSSNERLFLPELIHSFVEEDEDGVVSRSIALIDYPSKATDVIAELKRQVDGIVVWGGEEAVKAYRNDLPARTRLVVFGPKLSLALVTRDGLAHHGLASVASLLAAEVSIWDQNACTAPQLCYVQGRENAARLVDELATALEAHSKELPPGEADIHTAVEIQKVRSIFEIAEARGEATLRTASGSVNWTVILDVNKTIDASPLHRTIRIVPFETVGEILDEAERIRGYLQTVGVAASPAEGMELAEKLARSGALRVLELGQMSGGEVDDPHDGAYDLPQLVHFVVTRLDLPVADMRPFDVMPGESKRALVDSRLRLLLDRARRSAYYGAVLDGVSVDGVDDLVKLPVLTRELMEAHMPPQGSGLLTGDTPGGYVSRSGGSTGEPKFSVYDGRDWDAMIAHAVDVFRAAGIKSGDRVANCMLAGDLYGSFVSFDHINCLLGARTFAFAGHLEPDVFLRVTKHFNINVIQAIPAGLIPVLKKVKALIPTFKIEKIVFAGAPMQRSDMEWLRRECGTERITSIIGANDGGQFAFQCAHMTGAMHHTVDDFNYIEIVDEKGSALRTGPPVASSSRAS